jgi:hypothetical protein
MYLINETYFIKELSVPNINEMDADNLTILTQYVDEFARKLLKDALGYDLFKELDTNITSGVLNVGAPQKWLDLVNGCEYTKDGKTYKWNGLIFTEGFHKSSLLAKFVFYHWLKDNVTTITGTGEKSMKSVNADSVNSNQRLVTVWNDFVSEYQGSNTRFPTIWYKGATKVIDWFGSGESLGYVSLIQFLTDNETNYPDANLATYSLQNQFGL